MFIFSPFTNEAENISLDHTIGQSFPHVLKPCKYIYLYPTVLERNENELLMASFILDTSVLENGFCYPETNTHTPKLRLDYAKDTWQTLLLLVMPHLGLICAKISVKVP